MNDAIADRLGTLFVAAFHIDAPAADVDLLEAGILDSLQFVELLVQLEEQFGLRVKIENFELDDLRTLGKLARLIATHGAGVDPAAAPSMSSAAP